MDKRGWKAEKDIILQFLLPRVICSKMAVPCPERCRDFRWNLQACDLALCEYSLKKSCHDGYVIKLLSGFSFHFFSVIITNVLPQRISKAKPMPKSARVGTRLTRVIMQKLKRAVWGGGGLGGGKGKWRWG